MDLRLNEDQELIKRTARDFLKSECPMDLIRDLENHPKGYPEDLWHKMAEMGLMGVAFPEEYGGTGQGFLELCVLIEEQGRACLPSPFFSTVVLCGLPIARFGTEAQKREYLGAIVSGSRILAYAEAEPGGSWDASRIELAATSAGNGYVLEGKKLFVPYAHVADDFLVATRTGGSGATGITLLLVDAKSPGITCKPLQTIGGNRQHEVSFHRVAVPEGQVLGQRDRGDEIHRAIHQWGAAAKCAEMVGGAQRVLEMSVAYAHDRVQFGRPIGTFQAIQHHCANMAVDVDGSRFIAYEAIWRLSEGLDAAAEVAMAKAWVSDAYQRVCTLAHQIHGAIGFTKEHAMQIYFRHAKASELAFGDGDYHREQVARKLGL